MLVERAPVSHIEQHEMSLESPSFDQENLPKVQGKQETKKQMFAPYKIMIGIVILFILALVAYKVATLAYAGSVASQINKGQSKFIQNADSSSGRDNGSSSGNSQSSRASRDSTKPMSKSSTADKTVIGGSDDNDEGEDPNDDDNESGDRRNSRLRKNKMSDTSSTEDDSD